MGLRPSVAGYINWFCKIDPLYNISEIVLHGTDGQTVSFFGNKQSR